ncbi:MAG: hypothetical protein WBA51_02070, partial [Erythrobacter sp.]
GVATADTLTQWHEWFYWVVLGMVAVHLTAIAYYAVIKQDNLVGPMLAGTKAVDEEVDDNTKTPLFGFIISASIAAGAAVWVAYGAPPLS